MIQPANMRILIGKTATFVQILCPMRMNRHLLRLVLVAVTAVAFSCHPRDRYVVFSGYAQGGAWVVKANMKEVKVKDSEVQASLDSILRHIDNSLSGYNKNSLLSAFNAGSEITPDSIFLDIYSRSVSIYDVTGGCVDPASAPLFDLWGFGFKSGEMPSDEKVKNTLSDCGMKRLSRDVCKAVTSDGLLAPSALLLPEAGDALPQLNYNAIAQGYSCDIVAGYLYSLGVKDMLVDIGEFFCDGLNPSGKPWTIGIDKPVDGNNDIGASLQGVFRAPAGPHGIVTSGNYRKFYVKDGRKYAHTIDPRSGRPVEHSLLSATIVAPDAVTADAYATWCMVVGLEDAKVFLEQADAFEGCLIYDEDGAMKTWCSSGFVLESDLH